MRVPGYPLDVNAPGRKIQLETKLFLWGNVETVLEIAGYRCLRNILIPSAYPATQVRAGQLVFANVTI